MKNVIVTPGRGGPKKTPRNYRKAKANMESLPKKEGMRKPHDEYNRKSPIYLLNPLYRFLEKNIGRHWDKIYSDICRSADSRTLLGKRLRDQVHWAVEFHVTISDGKVYGNPKFYNGLHELSAERLYIDPNSGILKKYKNNSKTVFYNESLEEKIVSQAEPIIYKTGSVSKEYKLEIINNKLYKICIKNGYEEFKTANLATADNADREYKRASYRYSTYHNNFRVINRLIINNMNEALRSDSPYIKKWAQLVVEAQSKIKKEKDSKSEKFENTLKEKKRARNEKKRGKIRF